MKRSNVVIVAVALLALVGLATSTGCGGALARPPEESRAERLVHAMDAAEERLDAERAAFDTLDPAACLERCRSSTSICDASTEICGIARELGDERSHARCHRAEEACRATRELVTSGGCACEPPAADVPPSS